jgi:hypothetical protein
MAEVRKILDEQGFVTEDGGDLGFYVVGKKAEAPTRAERIRGKPTWPDWKKAAPGTRVRHVQTGATGTFVKKDKNRHNGAIIDWDDTGFGVSRGNVVSAAYDLEPITEAEIPREVDEELAEVHQEIYKKQDRLAQNTSHLLHLAGAKFYYRGRRRVTDMKVAEAHEIVEREVARMDAHREAHKGESGLWLDFKGPIAPYDHNSARGVLEKRAELKADLARLDAKSDALNAKYTGWSRFFLVTSSAGHVHSSMNCSTTYPTTRFGWLPNLSGKGEEEAVKELGPTLCTVCFPSAPTEWTEGKKLTAAQAEKKAREAAEAAKKKDAPAPGPGAASPREQARLKRAESDLRKAEANLERVRRYKPGIATSERELREMRRKAEDRVARLRARVAARTR